LSPPPTFDIDINKLEMLSPKEIKSVPNDQIQYLTDEQLLYLPFRRYNELSKIQKVNFYRFLLNGIRKKRNQKFTEEELQEIEKKLQIINPTQQTGLTNPQSQSQYDNMFGSKASRILYETKIEYLSKTKGIAAVFQNYIDVDNSEECVNDVILEVSIRLFQQRKKLLESLEERGKDEKDREEDEKKIKNINSILKILAGKEYCDTSKNINTKLIIPLAKRAKNPVYTEQSINLAKEQNIPLAPRMSIHQNQQSITTPVSRTMNAGRKHGKPRMRSHARSRKYKRSFRHKR
jgi:hypothetical protein